MKTPPVYQVDIPEYQVKEFDKFSGEVYHTQFGTPVPIEYWESRPDFTSIATKIISLLREHYSGKKIGLRLLSSDEHPNKSADDLVEIIKKLGHDRYDAERAGDRYKNIKNKKIEIFALKIEVGKEKKDNGEEQIQYALESFYTYPIKERGKPTRIDICIVYDLDWIEPVAHQYDGREGEVKTDGYVFKHSDRKQEAVLGIIKITSA
jgi:hypothetical protein